MKLSTTQIRVLKSRINDAIDGKLDGMENGESTEYALFELDAQFSQWPEHGDLLDVEATYTITIVSELFDHGTRFTPAETLTTINIDIQNIEIFNEKGLDIIETEDKIEIINSLKNELTEIN